MSAIGRMLDTLEVRTSLLDRKVYYTPLLTPKYVKKYLKINILAHATSLLDLKVYHTSLWIP